MRLPCRPSRANNNDFPRFAVQETHERTVADRQKISNDFSHNEKPRYWPGLGLLPFPRLAGVKDWRARPQQPCQPSRRRLRVNRRGRDAAMS